MIPYNLNYENCNAPVEYRYNETRAALHAGVCNVIFKKINGDLREMPCTLHSNHMPANARVVVEENDNNTDYDTVVVWCTDKQAWRAMKTMNIVSVEPMLTSWTVAIEEDAAGDAVLPLPPEVLRILDLKEGDAMNWTDNADGTWTMSKSAHK